MRKLLLALALLLIAGAAAFLGTQSLPAAHTVARSGRYMAVTTDEAAAAAFDIAGSVAWRTDLKSMEQLPDLRGHEVWRETWADGTVVTLETVEQIKTRRLTRCVIDQDGPFGGCWKLEVSPRDKTDSVVEITESLQIRSVAWRALHPLPTRKAHLDGYLRALGAKLGPAPKLADKPRDLNTPIPKREPVAEP